ncbi:MAG: hypothetical protein JWO88_639 [Frankiales bacterium]|jgi:hypothetical protein|nr:hypothetical protein [Frankiales bacterium]
MSTITDDDLTRLLDEAASSYEIPEHGPDEVLAALADLPVPLPLVKRRWVQLSAAAAVVTAGAVLAVAMYGGNDPSTKMTVAGKADQSLAPGAVEAPSAGGGSAAVRKLAGTTRTFGTESGGTTGGTGGGIANTYGAVPAPLSAPAAAAPGLPGVALDQQSARTPLTGAATGVTAPKVNAPATDDGESRVVKSGSIALVVKDKRVTPTLSAVQQAAAAQGGYIAASNTDEYGETPSGEVTIRVPVSKFETLVAKIRALDAKVRTASTSGKDVTATYSDLEAQLRSLKATRERFYTILTKTKTIGEILTVQQRIDNVSGQIDRIEGQRKLLANQSDLSTLTVSVSEEGDPVVKATTKPRSGISQAFHDAWDGFVTGVEAIISHSGRALLWLLSLGLLLLIARGGWRVARRRMV